MIIVNTKAVMCVLLLLAFALFVGTFIYGVYGIVKAFKKIVSEIQKGRLKEYEGDSIPSENEKK